ncbi:hypothetical protein B7486_58725 [cyanobacterium TDX16]|nr:hypothetical protein B7486_58725 [cyanobacterium TDX16]
MVSRLVAQGAVVRAYDPAVTAEEAQGAEDLAGIEVVDDPYAAVEGAEVLVVLTEWDELKWNDLGKVKDAMASPRVLDARNLLDRSALLRRGFTFEGVGRT